MGPAPYPIPFPLNPCSLQNGRGYVTRTWFSIRLGIRKGVHSLIVHPIVTYARGITPHANADTA